MFFVKRHSRPHRQGGDSERSGVVLSVKNLKIETAGRNRPRAVLVQDVSFDIQQGEMLALAGESGSGKSLTAAAVSGILPNALQASGELFFHNRQVHEWDDKRRRRLLGKEIGWVFQDYQGSLTPFMKVGAQLAETALTHKRLSGKEAKRLVLGWLDRVGLHPERTYGSYPFQLSGGQRQRAALAAALLPRPSLLIADEPTTALDVLTGERMMDLITELQAESGCAVLFITHDLRHVWRRADRLAVMKQGRIVEAGTAAEIRVRPVHPYTRELLEACPRVPMPEGWARPESM
ncbi:ABC transporter ATP-binding protein [Paenibacillus sp. N4]|uniref:ABC transporter ATP-binding protein n=1 Tax=Paenibacillus vietnamensis TaxID=2590547 RepID=UPI001CD1198D|nr:ABC transporter ATP-binding protein [Paenibacillus vietnamensis]MCA0756641.1 ABC transporter ATP-binding protein [Paenibacillus vietnamensis]